MVFKFTKKLTQFDPTGLTGKAVDTLETGVDVAYGGAKIVAKTGYNTITDPIGSVGDFIDGGTKLIHGVVQGFKITISGVEIEIDTEEAAELLYNAIVPKTAQSILRGEMPTQEDFQNDAISWIGGPIEGLYVASNSPSAVLIAKGHVPPAEMLGKDMVAALTPVAKKRLGL